MKIEILYLITVKSQKGVVYMQENTKRLNVVINNNLHRDLKVEVAKQGITIAQFVSEAIVEKIERQRGDNNSGTKKD